MNGTDFRILLVSVPTLLFLFLSPPILRHLSHPKLLLKQLSENKLLIVPNNYNERTFLQEFIKICSSPDAMILGGSRIMNIRGMLNAGVSRGTIQDYINIWESIKLNHKIPKTLILCLDRQSFSEAKDDQSYSDDTFTRSRVENALNQFFEFITIFKIIDKIAHERKLPAKDATFSFIYPFKYENKSDKEIIRLSYATGVGENAEFKTFKRLYKFDLLELLMRDIKKHSFMLVILLPYSPIVLKVIAFSPDSKKNMEDFRADLCDLCRRLGVYYYDGMSDRLEDLDFMDGVHLKTIKNNEFFNRALLEAK